MQIKNGKVFSGELFVDCDLLVQDGRIARLAPAGTEKAQGDVLDAAGGYVVPGFIDMHIHGAAGCDFSDGEAAGIQEISRYLAQQGVTGFLGTSMTLPERDLAKAFEAAKPYIGKETGGAVLRGIHMEGPFLSRAKKGAQSETDLRDPDTALFDRLNEQSGNAVKIVDVAPELPGAQQFIRAVSQRCRVSLAHTAADYETARLAFDMGAKDVTHLFNAMTPFTHRDPGVLAAAQEQAQFVELIADGVHLHPATVRLAFSLFGADRVCLISDAMRACGMHDGSYTLGGQEVTIQGSHAALADGTLAGSVTNLAACVALAVKLCGIPLPMAVKAAAENPAKALGIFDEVGSIEPGKRADLVVLDPQELKAQAVVIGGKRVL